MGRHHTVDDRPLPFPLTKPCPIVPKQGGAQVERLDAMSGLGQFPHRNVTLTPVGMPNRFVTPPLPTGSS